MEVYVQKSIEEREVSKRKYSCMIHRKHLRVHIYKIKGIKDPNKKNHKKHAKEIAPKFYRSQEVMICFIKNVLHILYIGYVEKTEACFPREASSLSDTKYFMFQTNKFENQVKNNITVNKKGENGGQEQK